MSTIKNILFTACLAIMLLASTSTFSSTIVNSNMDSRRLVEKYSLKNIGNSTHKTATFNALKSSLIFKGFSNTTASADANSNYMKYNKGNISYVIPYRYKVVLSKFKTPSPVQP
ncbi:MAG: hypothetical protein WCJ68_04170 [Chitinophagia bacterium]|jgi:hypothetical protein